MLARGGWGMQLFAKYILDESDVASVGRSDGRVASSGGVFQWCWESW